MGQSLKPRTEQIADLRETIARLQAELIELEVLQHRADEINAGLDNALGMKAKPKKIPGP